MKTLILSLFVIFIVTGCGSHLQVETDLSDEGTRCISIDAVTTDVTATSEDFGLVVNW